MGKRLSRRELRDLHFKMLLAQELRRRRLHALASHVFYAHILRLASFTTKQGSVKVRSLAGEDNRLVGDAIEAFLERYGIPFESEKSVKGRRIRVLDVPALRKLLKTTKRLDDFVDVVEEIIEELEARYALEGSIHVKKRWQREGSTPS
jgi:hypothetical protein